MDVNIADVVYGWSLTTCDSVVPRIVHFWDDFVRATLKKETNDTINDVKTAFGRSVSLHRTRKKYGAVMLHFVMTFLLPEGI